MRGRPWTWPSIRRGRPRAFALVSALSMEPPWYPRGVLSARLPALSSAARHPQAQRAGLDGQRDGRRADRLAVDVRGKRNGGLDADASRPAHAHAWVPHVRAPVDGGGPGQQLDAAERAEHDDVEHAVRDIGLRRDLHPAAEPSAVGGDDGGDREGRLTHAIQLERRVDRTMLRDARDHRSQVWQGTAYAYGLRATRDGGVEAGTGRDREPAPPAGRPLRKPEIEGRVAALGERAHGR